ncbi:PepSY domain-containing protein [Pseudomonas nicosulfuronedens]
MWQCVLLVLVLVFSKSAFATIHCTSAETSTWQKESRFRASIKNQGYRITRFRITPGNCYEIHGFNTENRRVWMYFNPVTGALVEARRVAR